MRTKLNISKKALLTNLQNYRRKTSSSFICPMVKANAYGVGESLVVRELLNANVTEFGVARVSEALSLRRKFPQDKFEILVFAPLTKDNIQEYIQSNLTAIVGSQNDLKIIASLDENSRRSLKKVHLNFDLGMSRLGFSFAESSDVKKYVEDLKLEVGGFCGHFSEADTFSVPDSMAERSLHKLIDLAGSFGVTPEKVHAPNTEALNFKNFDVGIRPGIGLYGIKGGENSASVLSLTAPLAQTRLIEAGDKVSYGGIWTSKEKSQIGVFSIGYAEGLKRALSGKISFTSTRPDRQAYPQVGIICMDYTMVNLGLDANFELGEEFTVFKDTSELMKWCDIMNCIPYEILTGLGDRVERILVK